jgi:hypothetical protein
VGTAEDVLVYNPAQELVIVPIRSVSALAWSPSELYFVSQGGEFASVTAGGKIASLGAARSGVLYAAQLAADESHGVVHCAMLDEAGLRVWSYDREKRAVAVCEIADAPYERVEIVAARDGGAVCVAGVYGDGEREWYIGNHQRWELFGAVGGAWILGFDSRRSRFVTVDERVGLRVVDRTGTSLGSWHRNDTQGATAGPVYALVDGGLVYEDVALLRDANGSVYEVGVPACRNWAVVANMGSGVRALACSGAPASFCATYADRCVAVFERLSEQPAEEYSL